MRYKLSTVQSVQPVATTQVSTVAYIAENLTLRPIAGLGAPVASQGYPDGTNARRAQVSIRVLF
ncbi:MAG TPA: hypothetical protein VNV86_02045 [Candidatus Acidoferrum sp.]|nr:hypothetical protein [Candidatus Acidoferrum sp.]